MAIPMGITRAIPLSILELQSLDAKNFRKILQPFPLKKSWYIGENMTFLLEASDVEW